METKFKVGDMVTLRTGSPEMTIYSIKPNEHIYCIWHSKNEDVFKRQDFPPEALTKLNTD